MIVNRQGQHGDLIIVVIHGVSLVTDIYNTNVAELLQETVDKFFSTTANCWKHYVLRCWVWY